MYLPDLTCCLDAVDTQKVYETFSVYFKYNCNFKTANYIKKMSNCYLFESIIGLVNPKENTGNLKKLN